MDTPAAPASSPQTQTAQSRKPRDHGTNAGSAVARAPCDRSCPTRKGKGRTAQKPKSKGRYHHGNLRAALVGAAEDLLAREGVAGLSLRAAARAAGVSQTAPYRHFKDREALLAAVAARGYQSLLEDMDLSASRCKDDRLEAVVVMGGTYIRFATDRPDLFRLMFGREIKTLRAYPDLAALNDEIAGRIGGRLGNPALGIGLWAAMHGLAWLLVEDGADLGEPSTGVLPSRAEIVLRALLGHLAD